MKKIMKFEADWCQPCKQLSAWIDDNASHLAMYDVMIETVNTDIDPDCANRYKVRSLPTVVDVGSGKHYVGVPECRKFLEGLQ